MGTKGAAPLRLGFIGFGTTAHQVLRALESETTDAHLVAALVRRQPVDPPSHVLVTNERDRFLAEPCDLVVELAGQEAVQQHAEAVLRAGRDLLIISIGALADDELFARLRAAAEAGGSRLMLPSGAIGGLDALGAGALGGLDEVTITTRKPPAALQTDTERDAYLAGAKDGPVLLYEGPTREAVRLFPANVNVAAAVSIAGVGFDRTSIRIFADPAVTRNTHEVVARGWFGELRFTIQNVPTENPKTGRITALSVLKAIGNLRAPVVQVG
ncbi:MAG: aspartate dehydrogenase [Chloroflexota bacterium]|jgi:aspartate dehydrogenase|nr:aspartate dehydrogenase [Chloroflexota bacterium]